MGRPEEAAAMSAATSPGWHITKRVGYVLAFLAVATVVVVGLLTYYVGVMNFECRANQDIQGPSTEKPKKQKVS